MRLYRATTDPVARVDAHFSEDVEDAAAYTDNQGFGGPRLLAYDVQPRTPLHAHSLQDLAEAYVAALDEGERDTLKWGPFKGDDVTPELVADYWGQAGFYHVFQVLENASDVHTIIQRDHDWVMFRDDFPEDAKTWRYLKGPPFKPVEELVPEDYLE